MLQLSKGRNWLNQNKEIAHDYHKIRELQHTASVIIPRSSSNYQLRVKKEILEFNKTGKLEIFSKLKPTKNSNKRFSSIVSKASSPNLEYFTHQFLF